MELNFDIENTEPENDAPSASYTEDDITTLASTSAAARACT